MRRLRNGGSIAPAHVLVPVAGRRPPSCQPYMRCRGPPRPASSGSPTCGAGASRKRRTSATAGGCAPVHRDEILCRSCRMADGPDGWRSRFFHGQHPAMREPHRSSARCAQPFCMPGTRRGPRLTAAPQPATPRAPASPARRPQRWASSPPGCRPHGPSHRRAPLENTSASSTGPRHAEQRPGLRAAPLSGALATAGRPSAARRAGSLAARPRPGGRGAFVMAARAAPLRAQDQPLRVPPGAALRASRG